MKKVHIVIGSNVKVLIKCHLGDISYNRILQPPIITELMVQTGTDDVTICKFPFTEPCLTNVPIFSIIYKKGAVGGPDLSDALLVGAKPVKVHRIRNIFSPKI